MHVTNTSINQVHMSKKVIKQIYEEILILKLEDLLWVVGGGELPRKIKFESFCILHSIVGKSRFKYVAKFFILSYISFLISSYRFALIYWGIE